MDQGHYQAFGPHLSARVERARAILEDTGFAAMVLHAGTPFRYHADDMDAPFKPNPHFAHWTPMKGPFHLLVVRPGKRPRLIRVAPEDYWYEQAPLGSPFWAGEFDLIQVGDEAAAWAEAAPGEGFAYVGDAPARAAAAGVPEAGLNPEALLARLDWDRSSKSAYEVACIEEAGRKAGLGHRAAREAFLGGASELEIHHAYVQATGCVDAELPYESIVALNPHGAILHYTGKRTERDGQVLLIDAGASHLGYASDITRTWAREDVDPDFQAMIEGMDKLELELCEMVQPGLPYPELQLAAHQKVADLLFGVGVLRLGGQEAVSQGLTAPFMPHGVGHFLGIQTHDVSGHQKEPAGGRVEPPAEHPFLRTTRTIEQGQVFTIEPGCYFIEMLLRPFRSGEKSRMFDWEAIDRLAPFGGVRVEDDLLATSYGHRNLTRPYV
ncbi:MAG: Xaa-Pro dipeptidase [Planctomycetes bacterium]|nr:Xaa-Pro dipeptidase [Planctomycetota bacterium]MBL7009337.1 Xaa-Pro dipeptidase [Planctomycetota bacterium]